MAPRSTRCRKIRMDHGMSAITPMASGALNARFVFIGAGGASLTLLQKSGIPEGHGYGGFPISGIWLRCDTPEVVAQHKVKVYGKAAHGSPPMSVPHLDMRVVDGEHSILFGPYAGFSPKFLKEGSWFDLCLLYTSPSPRDGLLSRMPSSA